MAKKKNKRVRRRKAPPFEVGCVYTDGESVYLGISPEQAVRFQRGVLSLVWPRERVYTQVAQQPTVECLCAVWGVSLEVLDQYALGWFYTGVNRSGNTGGRHQTSFPANKITPEILGFIARTVRDPTIGREFNDQ